MLDMGFLPPLTRIMAAVPAVRQTLMLSATLSPEIVTIAKAFLHEPVRIDVAPGHVVPSSVAHKVYVVAQEHKKGVLAALLTAEPLRQTLVFCRTKHGSDRVARHLDGAGLRTAVIHGDKSQGARKRALADFKAGRVDVLVATDVAARGLDIERLPLVVNYDLPLVAQDYIHRIGRTGRAGLAGQAISLASHAEQGLLQDIQRLLPSPIERGAAPASTWPTAALGTGRRQGAALAGDLRRPGADRRVLAVPSDRSRHPKARLHRRGQRRWATGTATVGGYRA
jgi:ATP-dependent RNA helicase RhlE